MPIKPKHSNFNINAKLPYGLTLDSIEHSMLEFISFLSKINSLLTSNGMIRLECFLMPANFSSIVGEFMSTTIPTFCSTLVKNRYHNGHPDLIPKGKYPEDKAQHELCGIEIKASKHESGWQGHNPENSWLLVFCFKANSSKDTVDGNAQAIPFKFTGVYGNQLTKNDWSFSGRNGQSRRTITASVIQSGAEKMKQNWIYKD